MPTASPDSDQSVQKDNLCRPIFQNLPENEWELIFQYRPHPPNSASTLPTIHSIQTQDTAPILPPPPHLMMHYISMTHQSVKRSLGHGEALKHCHGRTAAHVGGSGNLEPRFRPESRRPSLQPASLSVCCTPSLPAPAQMPLLHLLLPQCCSTHSTPLCPLVTTKHLTLTLSH